MAANTIGRLFGYSALSIAGALAALAVSYGLAAATPRTPPATDDQVPAIPFDPGALVNAIDDYASLLSILTGGHRAAPGVAGPATAAPVQSGQTGAYPVIPGVPYLPDTP